MGHSNPAITLQAYARLFNSAKQAETGLAALVAAAWYVRRNHMPALRTCDSFAPGLALGHSIGRLGCFAAGCCWGTECNLPWAVKFHDPAAYALTGVPLEIALHPAQLYESGSEALVFGFLYWRFGKQHAPGQIIGLYLVLSSVLRFFIEFFRNHEQALPFGLPLSITQWIAVGLAAVGAVLAPRRPIDEVFEIRSRDV